jgi:hypothetical protein
VNAFSDSRIDGDTRWAPLIDVSGMAVSDLVGSEDTALERCVRRLIDSLDDPNGVISAFSSFASQ